MKRHITDNPDRVLEEIAAMPLPEDENLFSLEIQETEGFWRIIGIVGPFARRISEGQDYPRMSLLPLSGLEFSSEDEAINFARKLNDLLIQRGMMPEGKTTHLLGLDY